MAEAVLQNMVVEPYTLQTIEPLPIAASNLHERDGALIHATFIVDEEQVLVTGDLAPLPTFNVESLASSIEAAKSCAHQWREQALPLIDLSEMSDLWEAFCDPSKDQPALSWALYQIASRVHAHVRNVSVAQLLGNHEKEADIYFLGGGKVKVRGAEDLIRLRGNERLDSNRLLSFDDAVELSKLLDGIEIKYWEEPLDDPGRLKEFSEQVGIKIALDESLRDDQWRDLHADVFVIKPTVLGWRRTTEVVRCAKERNLPCVVSTAYESNIGREFLSDFAMSIGAELGLGRPQLFLNDFEQSCNFRSAT